MRARGLSGGIPRAPARMTSHPEGHSPSLLVFSDLPMIAPDMLKYVPDLVVRQLVFDGILPASIAIRLRRRSNCIVRPALCFRPGEGPRPQSPSPSRRKSDRQTVHDYTRLPVRVVSPDGYRAVSPSPLDRRFDGSSARDSRRPQIGDRQRSDRVALRAALVLSGTFEFFRSYCFLRPALALSAQ